MGQPVLDIVDARQHRLTFDRPPERIISLVPSITESLFEIGAGSRVVGVSRFCNKPDEALTRPKVGGQKDPDFDALAALKPDLVILNLEENKPEHIDAISEVHPTWVTFPRTFREAAVLLRDLGRVLGANEIAGTYARRIDDAVQALKNGKKWRFRTLYVIWRHPWMSINQDTFIHDVLNLHGLENIFGQETRRYFEVTFEDIQTKNPEVILLPDEPFRFREKHLRDFATLDVDAVKSGRVFLVDGSYFCWYGTRSARCSDYIRNNVIHHLIEQGT